jgi:hypothetical protein
MDYEGSRQKEKQEETSNIQRSTLNSQPRMMKDGGGMQKGGMDNRDKLCAFLAPISCGLGVSWWHRVG